jgi:multicomponent Na+:H+ antiporter subunit E
MNRFFWNLILAFVWVAVTGEFTALNFLAGFLLAYLVIVFTESKRITQGYGRQVIRALLFALFYLQEVVLSSLRVALDVLRLRPGSHPAIVAVPLEPQHTEGSITLLANLITMTPGTMSLDVSRDRKWLYIHAMFVEDVDHFRKHFKSSFERRVLEVMT